MDSPALVDGVKLVLVCLLWYICSAGGNIIGKMVLSEFPFPITVTMGQLMSISVYMTPILWTLNTPHTGNISKKYYFTMVLPLAFGKFFSSVSSHFSMWKVPVSYAHTVKATLPMFTVIFSRILLGEKQTKSVYFSIMPIIGGVLIASLTEISFDMMGLLSALFATMGFSLQSIFSKKCLKETGIHHLRLLVLLSQIATVCFLPVWFLFDFRSILQSDAFMNNQMYRPLMLLFFDGIFYMLHNIFAFTVIAMVVPLSYSVANAMKRIVIIGASLAMLRNPVTAMNIIGMVIAVCGVLCYNKAKYDQNKARRRAEILPYVHSETNLTAHLFKKGLPHSKTEANLLNRNGMIHPQDHILLQNDINVDHFTILPPAQLPKQRGQVIITRNIDSMANLHSRSSHRIFDI